MNSPSSSMTEILAGIAGYLTTNECDVTVFVVVVREQERSSMVTAKSNDQQVRVPLIQKRTGRLSRK
jgi:hypothetical protein